MKCPKCGRRYGCRTRVKTKEGVCGTCGYVGKRSEFEEKERQEK
jgi:transcription initiation factor TFIIIB Brf1 subunit/transcription initiation factor TFIIB